MSSQYTVTAYSTTANQTVRQFNLEGNRNNEFTAQEAALWAEAFAKSLNQKGYLEATDWSGRVVHEETGIQTLVDSMNSQPITYTESE